MHKSISTNWIIGDTHWYHDEIQVTCNRPMNHTELSIENLRTKIMVDDLLLHLGDVIFYNNNLLKSIMDSIKGTKILLVGNHDHKSKGWYRRNGFSFAADMIVIDNILYSHRPIKNLPSRVKLNVHGHIHIPTPERMIKYPWWSKETHKLYSLEEQNYQPVKVMNFAR